MGENTLRKIVRYVSTLTFVNGMLFALEQSMPSNSMSRQFLEKSI